MKNLVFLSSFLILISCTTDKVALDEAYLQELNKWKSERLRGLKAPLGYLSMVGLYWLKEGKNSFGSAPENDIILASDFPNHLGDIIKTKDTIQAVSEDINLKLDGEPFDSAILESDAIPGYKKLNFGSYYWYLIKRGDRYGIRVKDTLADMRLYTRSLPYFEPNAELIIEAEYIAPLPNESTAIKNHVGITYQSEVKGRVRFSRDGKDYELIGTNGGNDILFIVFGDDTNGDQTYGGGRFLYVNIPQEGQPAILDFNKAENPICALNDFGTCPYPPSQNILDFPITAGEQKVK